MPASENVRACFAAMSRQIRASSALLPPLAGGSGGLTGALSGGVIAPWTWLMIPAEASAQTTGKGPRVAVADPVRRAGQAVQRGDEGRRDGDGALELLTRFTPPPIMAALCHPAGR